MSGKMMTGCPVEPEMISRRIKEILRVRGVSTYRLMLDTELSRNCIYSMVKGKSLPDLSTLAIVCERLEVTLRDFFDLEGEHDPLPLTRKEQAVVDIWREMDERSRDCMMAYAEGLYAGFLENRREQEMKKTVRIDGMMCAHCEATVKKAMEDLPFVSSAEVSHEKGTAVLTLSGEWEEEAVKKAVEEKDYTFVGVE